MIVFIFSPDGQDYCQFMTPNFPKPIFLNHLHIGLVEIYFFLSQHGPGPRPVALALALGLNLAQAEPRAWSRLGPIWVPFGVPFLFGAHLGPFWGPILVGAHLGPIWGPIWRPKAD